VKRTSSTWPDPHLADLELLARRQRREPLVDPVAQVLAVPGSLLQRARREAPGAGELSRERLLETQAVGRAEQRTHELRDERAVERVAGVGRGDEVGLLREHRAQQRRQAVRRHARDLGVEHDQCARLQQVGGGEHGADPARLSRHAVVGDADAVSRAQAERGEHGLALDQGRLAHRLGRPVARAAVDVEQQRALARVCTVEHHVRRAHRGRHGVGVVERRQPDQDVDLADRHQLGEQLVGEDRAHSQRSRNQKKL
jgi:hypothetical protein